MLRRVPARRPLEITYSTAGPGVRHSTSSIPANSHQVVEFIANFDCMTCRSQDAPQEEADESGAGGPGARPTALADGSFAAERPRLTYCNGDLFRHRLRKLQAQDVFCAVTGDVSHGCRTGELDSLGIQSNGRADGNVHRNLHSCAGFGKFDAFAYRVAWTGRLIPGDADGPGVGHAAMSASFFQGVP
jgi:hypothetical protein